jgi:hypothetical protein
MFTGGPPWQARLVAFDGDRRLMLTDEGRAELRRFI